MERNTANNIYNFKFLNDDRMQVLDKFDNNKEFKKGFLYPHLRKVFDDLIFGNTNNNNGIRKVKFKEVT